MSDQDDLFDEQKLDEFLKKALEFQLKQNYERAAQQAQQAQEHALRNAQAQQQFGWSREQMKQAYGVPFGGYWGFDPAGQRRWYPPCKCGLTTPHTKDECRARLSKEPPKRRKEREVVSVRMPFGKHKGTPIVNLPTDYLDWVLDWMDSEESGWMSHSRKRLFDELDCEYERRKTGQRPTRVVKPTVALPPEARKLLPEFIKSGYRAMALKVHPDKGGTPEQMIALRQLKEALEKL